MKLNYNGQDKVQAPPAAVWAFVQDPERVARCLPEVQDVQVSGPQQLTATVNVGVGMVRGKFKFNIDVQPDDPRRIREFLEKPSDPVGLPDAPSEVLASMGNYVFDADALVEAVTWDAQEPTSKHDMGGDIVPYFVRRNAAGGLDLYPNQSSGVLTSTVWGDGVVDNPPGHPIARGDTVQFIAFSEWLA